MLEPSLADAAPGSHWQLERVGYFVVDSEDSRPGAPVLNRVITLRDSWQAAKAEPEPVGRDKEDRARSAKAATRPRRKSRAEYRAEARRRDAVLAERRATWPAGHGISDTDAELLTGDRATGDLFTEAVAAGAPPDAAARWIINEVPHELGDGGLAGVPMTGGALGRLIRATESGAVSRRAAKEVLAELVQRGGEPEPIIAARGLAQDRDEAAVAALLDQVLADHSDEVAEYRSGKTALLGFFVGQAVRASRGTADPQVIRTLLVERLG
jgi:glutaminyl-tRNA synthetase